MAGRIGVTCRELHASVHTRLSGTLQFGKKGFFPFTKA